MIDYTKLGRRIQRIRHERGLTQAELAERADVSPPYISHIERGVKTTSLDTLVRIAESLGVTLDELLADSYPREREGDILYTETEMILERCSAKERRIAMEMLEALVSSMIRNRGKDEEE